MAERKMYSRSAWCRTRAGLLVAALAVAIGAGNVHAQEQPAKAENDPAQNPAQPNDEKPLKVKAMPGNIQLNSSVSFSETGAVNGKNSYFNFSFSITPPANVQLRNVRNVKVLRVVTDANEDLTAGLQNQNSEHFQVTEELMLPPGADRNRFRGRRFSNISLPLPKRPASKLIRFEGTAEIDVAAGQPKRLNVGTIKQVDGKKIKIEGVPDGWIQFSLQREGNPSRINVLSNPATMSKVARLYFFDADANLIQNQGMGGSSFSSGSATPTVGVTVYGPYQETTSVVVILYPESKTRKVEFEASDIALPPVFAEGEQASDMVLKMDPLEEAFALADIAPKPLPKELREQPAKQPAAAKGKQEDEGGAGIAVKPLPDDPKKVDEIGFTLEQGVQDPRIRRIIGRPAVKQPAEDKKAEKPAEDKKPAPTTKPATDGKPAPDGNPAPTTKPAPAGAVG